MHREKPSRKKLKSVEKFVGNAAWEDFVAWCLCKNLKAVPANEWALAAYIRSLEATESLTNIKKRVADIGKAHAEKSKRRPERHPLIANTIKIIELKAEKSGVQSRLFDDDFADPEASKPRKARPVKKKQANESAASPKLRVMRSQPKLVSKRRPK